MRVDGVCGVPLMDGRGQTTNLIIRVWKLLAKLRVAFLHAALDFGRASGYCGGEKRHHDDADDIADGGAKVAAAEETDESLRLLGGSEIAT